MLGVARELVEADRTGSWQMHLDAISDCLPIFSAAGHPTYLKSALRSIVGWPWLGLGDRADVNAVPR